jgi:hypothetical protein
VGAIKVYAVRSGGRAAEIGLRSGDRVVAVNGQLAADEPHGIVWTLYHQPRLIIRLRRDGESRVLSWRAAVQ